jgi:hypothetical protein
MRTLNTGIGIDKIIYDLILSAILASTPLYKIEDPVKLLSEKLMPIHLDSGASDRAAIQRRPGQRSRSPESLCE